LPSICFFVATTGAPRNDNARRLPAAFAARGFDVVVVDHDTIAVDRGRIVCGDATDLASFDLLWPLGLGRQSTFLDRMQLLALLPAAKYVVRPHALLTLHAKYALPLGPLAEHHPETHASPDPERLAAIVERGGEWIAKPPGASFGRDVYRLRADDPNLRVVLDSLTGHDRSRYAIVQRFVPEIGRGEKRVLVAGGTLIGCYLRRPGPDHRANLAADARAERSTLDANEVALAQRCADWLAGHGVHFAAVDLAYPWIVEFNIANPGGLETIERLGSVDLAPVAAAAITRALLVD
jgi:glutathione synthase